MGMPDESDAALAVRAQSGDRSAFESLIHRHKKALYRLIRRYVGNGDDAYDVLQETFLAAWIALNRYDASRDFSTWLRTIALNKCRDFGRRQSVQRRLLNLLTILNMSEQASVSAEIIAESETRDNERLRDLDAAIAALPPFYKEPLLLTAVAGLSQQEAAVQLQTTVKAIEMRLRRARKRLEKTVGGRRHP